MAFFDIFKKTEQKEVLRFDPFAWTKSEPVVIEEPKTLANIRLQGGANDFGAKKALRMYNSHRAKISNQWVNPLQSINSGYATAQFAYYNYQNVNYYECFALAQDPLLNKVFNLLSKTPFSKGGQCVFSDAEKMDDAVVEKNADRIHLQDVAEKALRSSFVAGGCLLYMDFGLDDLEQPLDLTTMDMRRFKGFRHIDPINIQAVEVNTIDPSKKSYMVPDKWYVLGLGVCDASHFIKWEQNVPELMMRPLCMYFGMPLTQLIKADIANANMTTQGVANLVNRFRNLYYKTDKSNFSSGNVANFKAQLETMSLIHDNWSVMPVGNDEEIMQLVAPIAGLRENVELFYAVVSSKTSIPLTELLGTSAKGLDATGEGDRRSWYDEVRRIQQSIKANIKKMYGIACGIDTGKFVKLTDYVFNPLEELDDKETVEMFKGRVEVAKAMIELGAKTEDVFNWLKSDKRLNIESIELDETAPMGDYGDLFGGDEKQEEDDKFSNDVRAENDKWITVHPNGKDNDGRPLLLKDGETPKDAMYRQWGIDVGKDVTEQTKQEEGQSEKQKDETFVNKTSDFVSDDKHLKSFEKEIGKLPHEELAFFDKNGELIEKIVGKEHSVVVSDEQLKKMENMVLTHNHPNGNVFSDADLFTGFGKTKLAELRAVTPDGTIYSLTPTEEARLPKLLVEYNQTEHKAERLFREMLDRKYRAGIITAEEKKRALYYDFNKYCNEKLIKMFHDKAREFGFNFKEYKQHD